MVLSFGFQTGGGPQVPQALISRPTAFAAKANKATFPYPFETENRRLMEVYYEGLGPIIPCLSTWASAYPAAESGMIKFPPNWFAPPDFVENATSWDFGFALSGIWIGAELDNGKMHSFVCELSGPADDPRNEGFWLTTHIPKGFNSFSSSGIVLWNKNKRAVGPPYYTSRISIEVMDPATGARFSSSPPSGARYFSSVEDTSFVPIQIPGSLLNSHSFQEGDMLKMFVHTHSIQSASSFTWRKFGKIEIHWDGT